MADDKTANKEKAKGVGAGARHDIQNQTDPEQDARQQNFQQGESREKKGNYRDMDDEQRRMKTKEQRSEEDY
jgi:hypothetical protein